MEEKKYKLIHNKTKEETICSLVTINSFDYYISEEEIKINDPITDNYRIWFWRDDCSLLGRKKVLCTNNPNINIPQIIDDEVDNAFHIVDNTKVRYSTEESDLWTSYKIGFEDGYNKAKETYKFTEENMTEFAQYVLDNISYNNDKLEEMLSTWKEQQIKTIYYD